MASNLISETTTAHAQPPTNELTVTYMREQIDLLRNPRPAQPMAEEDVWMPDDGTTLGDVQ